MKKKVYFKERIKEKKRSTLPACSIHKSSVYYYMSMGVEKSFGSRMTDFICSSAYIVCLLDCPDAKLLAPYICVSNGFIKDKKFVTVPRQLRKGQKI